MHDGEGEFVHVKVPLEDFTSERFGVHGDASRRF